MRLLKFELYKIFMQKSIWITFIVLLIMSYLSLSYPYETSLEKNIYQKWEGPLTKEEVQIAKSEYADLMKKKEGRDEEEEQIYSDREQIEIWMFRKIIMAESIENNVAERITELKNEKNPKANQERKMLEKVSLPDFSYHTGPVQTVGFVEFGSFLVMGVMLLLGLSPIYSKEYSTGVDNYQFSSKKGRKPLVWTKIAAALIYTVAVVLSWELFNFTYNYLLFGFNGWDTPLQFFSLHSGDAAYVYSPYALSLLDYHFIQLGIHLAGAISFALLIVLISSMSKHSLTTFFISASIFIVPEFLPSMKWLNPIKDFSFISIVRVQFLFTEYKTVDLFGIPILYPIFACFVMIVVTLISILGVLLIMKNREITS
jgi:hypothetical protein